MKKPLDKKELRQLVSELYCASGCSCCRDDEKWNETSEKLAKLLGIPKFKDGRGYDFWKFKTNHYK